MITIEQIIAILTTITTAISTIVAILQNKAKNSKNEDLKYLNKQHINLVSEKIDLEEKINKMQAKIDELIKEKEKLFIDKKLAEDKLKIAEITKNNKKGGDNK